jgi:hypothetical protein
VTEDDQHHEEIWLEFVAMLDDLVRCDHLDPDFRLTALHQALTRAIGGSVIDATDFAQRAILGVIE